MRNGCLLFGWSPTISVGRNENLPRVARVPCWLSFGSGSRSRGGGRPRCGWWLLLGRLRRPQRATVERARKLFHLQRERLEHKFFTLAAKSGKPRGLEWTDCEFEDGVSFARDRHTGRLRALVGVTVRFKAIEGGGMEDNPNVGLPRAASCRLPARRRRLDHRRPRDLQPQSSRSDQAPPAGAGSGGVVARSAGEGIRVALRGELPMRATRITLALRYGLRCRYRAPARLSCRRNSRLRSFSVSSILRRRI